MGLKNHMEGKNSYLTCISLGFMHINYSVQTLSVSE